MPDKLSGTNLSLKKKKDLDSKLGDEALKPDLLTSVCDQATSFSTERLRNWLDIENHARTPAPMMGIHPETFEKAKNAVGAQKNVMRDLHHATAWKTHQGLWSVFSQYHPGSKAKPI